MTKIKVNRELAIDLLDGAVFSRIVGKSRWSIRHEAVIPYEDKFYMVYYQTGATEMQEESPFEYEDEVELTEVQQVERLVKVWEPIE